MRLLEATRQNWQKIWAGSKRLEQNKVFKDNSKAELKSAREEFVPSAAALGAAQHFSTAGAMERSREVTTLELKRGGKDGFPS